MTDWSRLTSPSYAPELAVEEPLKVYRCVQDLIYGACILDSE
jgi:hypothetical protein